MTKNKLLDEELLSKVSGGDFSPAFKDIVKWSDRNWDKLIDRYHEKHPEITKKDAEWVVSEYLGYTFYLETLDMAKDYLKNKLEIEVDDLL